MRLVNKQNVMLNLSYFSHLSTTFQIFSMSSGCVPQHPPKNVIQISIILLDLIMIGCEKCLISVSGKRVSETLLLPNSELQSKVNDHMQSAIKAILIPGSNNN